MKSPIQTTDNITLLEKISVQAGNILLRYYYDPDNQDISEKADQSVVTAADLNANRAIIKALTNHFPNIPIVSEENDLHDNLDACKKGNYFMIDPLDGTSSFIKQSDEFTVNIAYIKNYEPSFGMIYCPVQKILYYTNIDGNSIKKNCNTNEETPLLASTNKNNLTVIATKREPEKSHITTELTDNNISIKEMVSISSSYKFCIMAEGSADLYPRRANISAWDIAAGHAIVNGASGQVLNVNDTQIRYEFYRNFKVPHFNVFGQEKII